MPLDLEVAGEITPLTPEEASTPVPYSHVGGSLKRLRESHHAVAKAIALGYNDVEAARMSGYSPQRLYSLRQDPAFVELVDYYRGNAGDAFIEFRTAAEFMARDSMQILHEILTETPPDQLNHNFVLEAWSRAAAMAGHGPINRTENRNLNLTIAERLDRLATRPTESQLPATTPAASGRDADDR